MCACVGGEGWCQAVMSQETAMCHRQNGSIKPAMQTNSLAAHLFAAMRSPSVRSTHTPAAASGRGSDAMGPMPSMKP